MERVLTELSYDPKELAKAWGMLVEAADSLKQSDGFKYDVVDVTRQVLANYASPLQQKWVAAYRNKSRVNMKVRSEIEIITG